MNTSITAFATGGGQHGIAFSEYTWAQGGKGGDGTSFGGGSGGGSGYRSTGNVGLGGAALTSPVVHGYKGGDATGGSSSGAAGGGGAGGAGVDQNGNTNGTDGGPAKVATITGSNVYYSAGGGGDRGWGGSRGVAGANAAGGANSGDGGDHSVRTGESGIVILKYPAALTITVGSGLTSSTANLGTTHKVTTFTAGTGNVQFN